MLPATECDRCCFFAHNPYLNCALHPSGPDYRPCPDYEAASTEQIRQNQDWFYPTSWFSWPPRRPALDDDWTAFWTAEEDPTEEGY